MIKTEKQKSYNSGTVFSHCLPQGTCFPMTHCSHNVGTWFWWIVEMELGSENLAGGKGREHKTCSLHPCWSISFHRKQALILRNVVQTKLCFAWNFSPPACFHLRFLLMLCPLGLMKKCLLIERWPSKTCINQAPVFTGRATASEQTKKCNR